MGNKQTCCIITASDETVLTALRSSNCNVTPREIFSFISYALWRRAAETAAWIPITVNWCLRASVTLGLRGSETLQKGCRLTCDLILMSCQSGPFPVPRSHRRPLDLIADGLVFFLSLTRLRQVITQCRLRRLLFPVGTPSTITLGVPTLPSRHDGDFRRWFCLLPVYLGVRLHWRYGRTSG